MSSVEQILLCAVIAMAVAMVVAAIDRTGCALGASQLVLTCEARP